MIGNELGAQCTQRAAHRPRPFGKLPQYRVAGVGSGAVGLSRGKSSVEPHKSRGCFGKLGDHTCPDPRHHGSTPRARIVAFDPLDRAAMHVGAQLRRSSDAYPSPAHPQIFPAPRLQAGPRRPRPPGLPQQVQQDRARQADPQILRARPRPRPAGAHPEDTAGTVANRWSLTGPASRPSSRASRKPRRPVERGPTDWGAS